MDKTAPKLPRILSSEISDTNRGMTESVPPPAKPPKILNVYIMLRLEAKITTIQLANCAIPMSMSAAFRPAISATHPQMSTARTHPTVPIEPIQPASEGVIVPELSGVALDSSNSKFGDSQPMDKPYMSVARFAHIVAKY